MSAPAPDPNRPKALDTVASADLDGEVVLFDERDGSLLVLDPVASIIWSFLDGTATVADLADDLAFAFEAPRDQVLADVNALVERLSELDLLVGTGGSDASGQTPEPGWLADPPST